MKKIFFAILSGFICVSAGNAFAAVDDVTPSTNDINRTNGWAHVNQIDVDAESVTLEFVSKRNFFSCFEYRTDGDTSQSTGDNFNPAVTDGLYPYVCVNNSTKTKRVEADGYVEVRMVFGAESDERFDWTRFDVLFDRTAEITSPEKDEVVSGTVSFDAILKDKDEDDSVQWAVRKGTCAAGTNTVFGNVDGYSDSYDWNGREFHSEVDTAMWEDGAYCFIFNPTESSGDFSIRETREFVINNTPDDMSECMNEGWKTFHTPTFKNQGDCISWLQSSHKAWGNRKNN